MHIKNEHTKMVKISGKNFEPEKIVS